MRGRPSRQVRLAGGSGNCAAGGRGRRADLTFSRAFLDADGKAVVTANSGPLRWPPESSVDAIMRAFRRIAGRDSRPTPASARLAVWGGGWPASRALAGAARRDPARSGATGRRSPAGRWRRAGWVGRSGSGYSHDQFGLLPRTTPTIGHLPWPERCSACIRLIAHSKIGPGLAGQVIRRAETTAGRQPFGVDTRLCGGGVVIRSCLGCCLVLAWSESFGFLLVISL